MLSVDVVGRSMPGIDLGIELRTGNFDKRGMPDVDFAGSVMENVRLGRFSIDECLL